jgi:hypothetical protein
MPHIVNGGSGGGGGGGSFPTGPGLVKVDGSTPGVASVASEGVDFNVPVTHSAIALYRARTLLGNTLNTVLGCEFDNDQYYTANQIGSGAGTATLRQDKTGGVLKLSSTASSGHGIIVVPHYASPNSFPASLIANGRSELWYARWRFQIATAVTAQTAIGLELINPSSITAYQYISMGVIGSLSASNFSWHTADHLGNILASGTTSVAVDNAFHTGEMYNDLTTLHFLLDGVEVATTASSNIEASTAYTIGTVVYNGTDAVTRDLNLTSMRIVIVGI